MISLICICKYTKNFYHNTTCSVYPAAKIRTVKIAALRKQANSNRFSLPKYYSTDEKNFIRRPIEHRFELIACCTVYYSILKTERKSAIQKSLIVNTLNRPTLFVVRLLSA